MKGVLEGSIYAIIMTFIILFSTDFVLMNLRVTKATENARYIEDFVEAYGSCEKDANGNLLYYTYNEDGSVNSVSTDKTKGVPALDSNIISNLETAATKVGMKLSIKYMDTTESYGYIEYTLSYSFVTGLIHYNKEHTYTGIARYSLI